MAKPPSLRGIASNTAKAEPNKAGAFVFSSQFSDTRAPIRLKAPRYRAPGNSEFMEVTWDIRT
jgi:hypothetical protein